MIDLRSDTVTRPTPGMRKAMAEAEVGDDVYGEDPSVNRLQERVAELLGKEAALFVPSGTMANQVALKLHTRPGDDVLLGENSHNWLFESGAAGAISGVQTTFVGRGGLFTAADVEAAIKPKSYHFAPTTLVCLENTHNMAGGRVWDPAAVAAILDVCEQRGLWTHLDGARLWNAAAALGRPEAELAARFETVSVCLSKGLGAPVGSLLAGSKALMVEARRIRKMLGGAMRQAGVLAAAGLYALEHHRSRLVEDHENARRLAEMAQDCPDLDVQPVETNVVMMKTRLPASEVAARAEAQGVRVGDLGAHLLRAVTHLDVSREQCETAGRILVDVARA